MREIKFRIWNKFTKSMYPSDYFGIDFTGKQLIRMAETEQIPRKYFVYSTLPKEDDLIIMQFTGLKDKNGKEIYEGDIVKRKEYYNDLPEHCIAEVCWDKNKLGFWVNCIGNSAYWRELSKINLEVIGNIYENPKLLKEKEI